MQPPANGLATFTITRSSDSHTSNTLNFQYAPPTISSLSPANGPSVGMRIAINGNNFGTTAFIKFNGQPVATAVQSQTQLQFDVPAGLGTSNTVTVTVAGVTTAAANFAYDGPIISTLSPTNSPTPGGGTLVI